LPVLLSLIAKLVVEEQWKDWPFANMKSLFAVNSNEVYHKLLKYRVWVQSKVLDTWHTTRGGGWCSGVFMQRCFFGVPWLLGCLCLMIFKMKTHFVVAHVSYIYDN
jgi:hypothetical protein